MSMSNAQGEVVGNQVEVPVYSTRQTGPAIEPILRKISRHKICNR